jgi:hypothetical protein
MLLTSPNTNYIPTNTCSTISQIQASLLVKIGSVDVNILAYFTLYNNLIAASTM